MICLGSWRGRPQLVQLFSEHCTLCRWVWLWVSNGTSRVEKPGVIGCRFPPQVLHSLRVWLSVRCSQLPWPGLGFRRTAQWASRHGEQLGDAWLALNRFSLEVRMRRFVKLGSLPWHWLGSALDDMARLRCTSDIGAYPAKYRGIPQYRGYPDIDLVLHLALTQPCGNSGRTIFQYQQPLQTGDMSCSLPHVSLARVPRRIFTTVLAMAS
mmetsp:Transcript_68372/g.221251  ORF Transcript_68372/g.221251 Transcript_68372/m.221251 type:complete len:210 (+) Transcript_68372:600-1229(+)